MCLYVNRTEAPTPLFEKPTHADMIFLWLGDIPAHTYQATFEPNHEWSQFYATSQEIHRYWKKVVAKYDCMRHIKLNHQIVKAQWDESQGKWQVQVSS